MQGVLQILPISFNARILVRYLLRQCTKINYQDLKILWNEVTGKQVPSTTCHGAAQTLGFKT